MRRIRISLRNSAGEIDHRIVETERYDADADVKTAVTELVGATAFFCIGDSITVREMEDE